MAECVGCTTASLLSRFTKGIKKLQMALLSFGAMRKASSWPLNLRGSCLNRTKIQVSPIMTQKVNDDSPACQNSTLCRDLSPHWVLDKSGDSDKLREQLAFLLEDADFGMQNQSERSTSGGPSHLNMPTPRKQKRS